jgi:hypothetical protein
MVSMRRHISPALWLALAAVLALALLPTLSHARAAAAGTTAWAEICTPQGTKLVATFAGDQAGDETPLPAAAVHLEHCPLCALSAQAVMLPPAAPRAQPPALPAHAVPRLFLQAPRTLFAWAPAQPRGPPSLA